MRESYHHGNLREALVEAGLELTREGGPAALVLRDIARRVGVSPNAVYRHFAGRAELLAGVATSIQHGMAERMHRLGTAAPGAAAVDEATIARARLRAVGMGYITFALDEPGWFEVAFAGADALAGAVDEAALPAPLAALLHALDGLVAAGELTERERRDAEWPCWSAVHGFALLALKGPLRARGRDEIMPIAERTVAAVIRGLAG